MLRQVGAVGGVLIVRGSVRKTVRVGFEIVLEHEPLQRLVDRLEVEGPDDW